MHRFLGSIIGGVTTALLVAILFGAFSEKNRIRENRIQLTAVQHILNEHRRTIDTIVQNQAQINEAQQQIAYFAERINKMESQGFEANPWMKNWADRITSELKGLHRDIALLRQSLTAIMLQHTPPPTPKRSHPDAIPPDFP